MNTLFLLRVINIWAGLYIDKKPVLTSILIDLTVLPILSQQRSYRLCMVLLFSLKTKASKDCIPQPILSMFISLATVGLYG